MEKRQFHYHFHAWRGCKCECCYKVFKGSSLGGLQEAGRGHGGWAEHIPVFIRFNGANTMSALANALCKCASSSTLAQPGRGRQGRGAGRRAREGEEAGLTGVRPDYITILCPGRICFLFSVSF